MSRPFQKWAWHYTLLILIIPILFTCTESETTAEVVHIACTLDSNEDRHPMPTPDTLQALPAIDFSNLGDFARRFERQSWRVRHEEERKRLKQRFEVRRVCQKLHICTQ